MHPEPPTANRREIFARLCGELPPPVPDTPDLRAARDEDSMDAVVALHPADAFEARLAVRIVAMDAHAGDCLRSAGLAVDDPEKIRRCRAQAASMARQADAALRSLQRIQATREKQMAEKHPAAMERAGYWFLSGASNFNWLDDNNQPDPKHYPDIGFRAAGRPGSWFRRADRLLTPSPVVAAWPDFTIGGGSVQCRPGSLVTRSFSASVLAASA